MDAMVPRPEKLQPATAPQRRERRVLAIVFSLLLGPGTGHLLVGRTLRGLVWAALAWAALASGFWVTPWLFAVALGLVLACMIDVGIVRPPARGVPGWFSALALCLVLVVAHQGLRVGMRLYFVELYKIPSGTMIPTLDVGDHVAVRKIAGQARRGDVIVFRYPQDPDKDFIKRVVAIGGDRIEVAGRELVLNGKPVVRRQVPGPCSYAEQGEDGTSWEPRECQAFDEELDGRTHRVVHDPATPDMPSRPTVVPADHVYVLGDNRDNSHDSRFWGTLPLANVKGRAFKVLWSSGPQGIRWERMNLDVR